ncbi:hypothetical protein GCM10010094_46510 [Streptomyces flaveus]|uniref:Uncharacterized protein n=1 Tax=Streptomyces flaveus TaxID=66370 RepID=A0A917VHZ5_9ACTN|nr:hypothetical protein GCM10010094_46510 [Streptomyces flaveus]
MTPAGRSVIFLELPAGAQPGRIRGMLYRSAGRFSGQPLADVCIPQAVQASRAQAPYTLKSVNRQGEFALQALKRAPCEHEGQKCSRFGTHTPRADHRAQGSDHVVATSPPYAAPMGATGPPT